MTANQSFNYDQFPMGRKATAEVRDAVYKVFVKFLEDLQENGSFTAEQVENLGDHMCNADEIGGDERGQSRKKVYKGKKRTTNLWRTIDLGGDHNPFHVTLICPVPLLQDGYKRRAPYAKETCYACGNKVSRNTIGIVTGSPLGHE